MIKSIGYKLQSISKYTGTHKQKLILLVGHLLPILLVNALIGFYPNHVYDSIVLYVLCIRPWPIVKRLTWTLFATILRHIGGLFISATPSDSDHDAGETQIIDLNAINSENEGKTQIIKIDDITITID